MICRISCVTRATLLSGSALAPTVPFNYYNSGMYVVAGGTIAHYTSISYLASKHPLNTSKLNTSRAAEGRQLGIDVQLRSRAA